MTLAIVTPGRIALIVAFLNAACAGAYISHGCAVHLMAVHALQDTAFWRVWSALLGLLSALAVMRMYFRHLGHPGWRGVMRTIRAQIYMCLWTALIVGTAVLPISGTLYAPLVLVDRLAVAPEMWVGLIVDLVASHVLVGIWHRERACPFERRIPVSP